MSDPVTLDAIVHFSTEMPKLASVVAAVVVMSSRLEVQVEPRQQIANLPTIQ